MTLSLFIFLFTICSTVASLFTEAIKKVLDDISSNVLALLSAILTGAVGISVTYIILGMPFDTHNIVCIILMVFSIWLGSMVGYDKVMQTLEQIRGGKLP